VLGKVDTQVALEQFKKFFFFFFPRQVSKEIIAKANLVKAPTSQARQGKESFQRA
jgi:hypothetical protein